MCWGLSANSRSPRDGLNRNIGSPWEKMLGLTSRNALAVSVVVMLILGGCDTTGGIIGGLIPAPKFLKGEINNDVYTGADKSFSVAVPQKADSYEFKYMQVKEQRFEDSSYVSFGPAAFDESVYRLETSREASSNGSPSNFEKAALKALNHYKSQLEDGYKSTINEKTYLQDSINDRRAFCWIMTQSVPPGIFLDNKGMTLTHYIYALDLEKGIAFVWVQVPDDAFSSGGEARARKFAASVVIH